MASSGKPPAHSGKLSDKTIFQNDDDSLMNRIWDLKKKKEALEDEINKTKLEIDGWLQILSCSTETELEELIDDFSMNPSILPACTLVTSEDDLQRLSKYSELVTELDAFELFDCCKAYTTKEGDILIKFPSRPPYKASQECLVLLKPEAEHTYSVRSHNLPPTVPIPDLAKKYLETPRHGAEGVRKFVAVIGQYTKALYTRLQQIMALESAKILSDTAVHHNLGATDLNFIINPRLKDYPTLLVEFVLNFDPLDILPETVTAQPLCLSHKDKVPSRLQEVLDGVTERMKLNTFPQVLVDLDTHGREAQPSTSSTTPTPAATPSSSMEQEEAPTATAASDSDSEETLAPLFDIGE